MGIAILLSVLYVFPKRQAFILPIQIIIFSVVISMFISTLSRDQGLIDSVIGSIPVLILIVFFYLKHIKFPIEQIEKITIGFGILYAILYFFQFMHPSSNYFIDTETVDDSRGITRFIFPGGGIFTLTTFIAINKLTTERKNRWFWSILTVLSIVIYVMQVTRQVIFAMLIIYLYHFTKDISLFKKIVLVSCVAAILFYFSQSDNQIVVGLASTHEQTQESGVDYIRVQAATFYLTDFSNTVLSRILGNGVPYGDTSPYYMYSSWYTINYGFWLSDVGLIAVYAMFGVFAVLGYFIIWLKSFFIKLPKEFFYLKYYLWFLLMTSLTSDSIYSPNSMIITVFVLYIYQSVYEKKMLLV